MGGRMRGDEQRPEGLIYRPELLTEEEERQVLSALGDVDFREFEMRGQKARRRVRHFGFDYGYESWDLTPADPLPDDLTWVRDRCASLAQVEPEALAQTLITEYPPGSGIGWHRDAPMFGPTVVGVSLLSPCTMRFQRKVDDRRQVYELDLAPRSAYVLSAAARSSWQHSVPAVGETRYSITFRTLRHPDRWSGERE